MSLLPTRTFVLLIVAVLAAGCSGRGSPTGFRLPPGDVAAGEKAFADLSCNTCHTVPGVDLPKPAGPINVALGGRRVLSPTDGDLTTDIILPSSHFATGYPADQVQEGSASKMPDYTQKMTVRQLADLVAFLQTKYGITAANQ
jgi:mono/diheme cytochrome c family protein